MLLVVYAMGWMASVLGAPAFAVLAGDGHDVSLLSRGGQTHIVLHHDSHTPSELPVDGWDTLCEHDTGELDCAEHPDHEFQLVDQSAPAILKSAPPSLLSAAVTANFSSAAVPKPALQAPPAPSASPPEFLRLIIGTIVLLI